VWHRDRHLTPAAEAFIQLARQMASGLQELRAKPSRRDVPNV
jgi:hypothetical protein